MREINPIIIPCHNGIALTRKAVESCLAQTVPVSIIVIDNGSTDGTSPWAWACPDIGYFHLPNASVSKCWNIGLRCEFEHSDHCLVINNDIELRPDAYELLLADGYEFVTGVGVKPEDWLERREEKPNGTRRPHPDFSCFLIRKSVIDKAGLFPEEYEGAYYEDNCWHVRAHRAGVHCVCIDVPFLHHAAGTLKNTSEYERIRLQHKISQNRERFFKEFGCYPATPEYDLLFTSVEAEAPTCTTV